MTLIASWIAVDNDKPSSIYIVSDSRFSWGKLANFDYGRKVFCFKKSSDILGYCGDVIFPTIVLNHLIELGDNGLLFEKSDDSDKKFEIISEYIKKYLSKYPTHSGLIDKSIDIIYGTRQNNIFSLYTLSWKLATKKWIDEKADLSGKSKLITALGSGGNEFMTKYEKYEQSEIKGTSRAVFQCFCHTLSEIEDNYCGGAPQLVGLYQKWNGINIGIISNNKRYLYGLEVEENKSLDLIDWRNEDFEICSGITMNKLLRAPRQRNPISNKRGNTSSIP